MKKFLNKLDPGFRRDDNIIVLKQYIKNCPQSSGVYKMLGANNEILYVGKAKDLRARLSSYLKPLNTRLQQLTSNIVSIETIPTKNEEEALLLELTLIKKFMPKYNVMLKDDKQFPYIVINEQHDFPKIGRYRGYKNSVDTYFGPFTSPRKVNSTISILQKAFLLRSCTDSMFKAVEKPCILYQLKRCSAPCVGKISKPDYANLVQQTKDFLSGKDKTLKQKLIKQMHQASEDLNYEAAAIYRDRIKALSIVDAAVRRETFTPSKYEHSLYELQTFFKLPSLNRIEIYDNSHIQGSNAVGVMVVFDKNGFNRSEYRTYNIKFNAESNHSTLVIPAKAGIQTSLPQQKGKNWIPAFAGMTSGAVTTSDDYYMMKEMLTRRLSKLTTRPDLLIIDGGIGHVSVAKQVCSDLDLKDIFIIGIAKGIDRNSGNENIYTCNGEKIVLDKENKLKYFLQNLRDEAHRFAITSHRKKRSKTMTKSALDDIKGIGKKRKNDLLKHFGSPENIKAASVEQLLCVKGINRELAELLHKQLSL